MKRISTFMSAVLIMMVVAISGLSAQSTTTGTLNLRNAQPSTVALTIPTTGVTGYTMELPSAIGSQGQALTVSAITGSTATLGWTSMPYWSLSGSSITTGGTAANQQYLGTSNAQDMVLAANGTEKIRIVGVTGAAQGFVGIGTSSPKANVDVQGDVLLSNSGTAAQLKLAEPSADGGNTTSFKAQTQTVDITYTLPANPPSADGQVLTATTGGTMSWLSPTQNIGKGRFTPNNGNVIHVINTAPFDLKANHVPVVTVKNAPGTTIAASITAIDEVANTITVETSTFLGPTETIMWVVIGD